MRLRSGGSQAVLSIVDQILSSLTNLVLGIFAARALSVVEFGVFSSVYILYTIVVGGVAAMVGQVIVLYARDDDGLRDRSRDFIAFSLILGLLAGIAMVCASIGLEALRGPLIVLGAALPLLLAQDCLRYGASALQKMEVSVISDALWLVSLTAIFVTWSAIEVAVTPTIAIAAWAIAGALAGLVCFPLLWSYRSLPDLTTFRSRDFLGYRFIGEYIAVRASSQGCILLLGAMAGLAATGAVRGIATIYGPLMVAMAAAASFGAPLIRRVAPTKRDRFLMSLSALLIVVCAVFSIVLAMAPSSVGRAVLGDSWDGALSFLPAMATQVICAAITTTSYLALRLVAPKSTLAVRLWTAAVVPPAFLVGYAAGGAVGALWGLTAASAVQAVVGCVRYLQLRSEGTGLAALGS